MSLSNTPRCPHPMDAHPLPTQVAMADAMRACAALKEYRLRIARIATAGIAFDEAFRRDTASVTIVRTRRLKRAAVSGSGCESFGA